MAKGLKTTIRIFFILHSIFHTSPVISQNQKWVRGPQLDFTGQFTQTFDSVKFINNGGYDDNGFGQGTQATSNIYTDFNNDGKKDIIISSYYNRKDGSSDDVFFLRFYQNNGNNTFTEVTKQKSEKVLKIFRRNGGYSKFDFDKDGKEDYFFGSGGFEMDSYKYIINPTLGLVKYVDYIDLGQADGGLIPRQQYFFNENGKLKEGHELKFDKKYFSSIVGQVHHDINSDGFEDIIVIGSVFSLNDSTKKHTRLSRGFGVFINNQGKYFSFQNGINTQEGETFRNIGVIYNSMEVRVDNGMPILIDINKDGYKDLLIYGRTKIIEYKSKQDSINNNPTTYESKSETRIYINNKGIFEKDKYRVIASSNKEDGNALNIKDIDINGDGKIDFIGMGGLVQDSLVATSGIRIFLNNGTDTIFEDKSKEFFPEDSLISEKKAKSNSPINGQFDFSIADIDNDGKIDIIPNDFNDVPYTINGIGQESGVPYLRYGWNPKNINTFYFKNINNQYFKRIDIGKFGNWVFFDTSSYFTYKNSIWFDFISQKKNYVDKNDSLLTNFQFIMNSIVPVDFDNDGSFELFGFNTNSRLSFSDDNFKNLSGLPKIEYPHPVIASFILYPCKPLKPLFNTTKYSFCTGDSLKLSITNVNKGDSFKWYYGTNSDITNVSNKTFTDSTKLFVTRTDSVGCISTSDTILLIRTPKPAPPILSRDADNNLVSNSIGNIWYKDGVKITDTTQKIKPTSNGIYTATTTQNGCTSALSQGYYYLTNAVANLTNGEYFKVSPNPTSGELNINYRLLSDKEVYISLMDMNGRNVILNRKIVSGTKINLGAVSKGNYIIQVKDKTGRLITTQKLVKE